MAPAIHVVFALHFSLHESSGINLPGLVGTGLQSSLPPGKLNWAPARCLRLGKGRHPRQSVGNYKSAGPVSSISHTIPATTLGLSRRLAGQCRTRLVLLHAAGSPAVPTAGRRVLHPLTLRHNLDNSLPETHGLMREQHVCFGLHLASTQYDGREV